MSMRRFGLPVIASLALLSLAQQALGERFRPGELLVEPIGGSPAELEAARLEVVEGGVARAVAAIEPLAEPWRIVLYFDLLLVEPPVYRSAVLDLAEQAKRLTELGTVEIVLADESVTVALPPTRDAMALDEALRWLLVRQTSEGGQMALRAGFVAEQLVDAEPVEPGSVLAEERITELGAAMRAAVEDEIELLDRQRAHLLSWLSDEDAAGPKAVVMVTSGFDSTPADFYGALVEKSELRRAALGLPRPEVVPGIDEVAQALAVYDWTVISYAPPNQGDGLLADDPTADPVPENVGIDPVLEDERTIVTVDPRKMLDRLKKRRQLEEVYAPRLLTPLEPLRTLADSTGGRVVLDRGSLGAALGSLGQRRVVRFEGSPDALGAPQSISLRWKAGKGPDLRCRAWTGGATPEVISAQRARRYLSEGVGEGEIFVSAAVATGDAAAEETTASRLVLEVGPEGLPKEAEQPLRVTLAVGRDQATSDVVHQVVDPRDAEASVNDSARFVLPVVLPADEEPVVVVFVEELASGRWGGAVASFSVASRDLSVETGSLILPAPKAIHLMAPREAMVMGRTTFDTVVSEDRVASVQFFLDGEQVAIASAPPFSTTVDLGRLPETHRIEAVAFGEDGAELGRDRLTVNAGMGAFRVRILKPEPNAATESRIVGPIEVEARVETPRGGELDRVEFFWKEQLVATRFAPPFLQRVTVPSDDASGFVRVVGHLEDGDTAEDVVFINSQGSTERLEVDLVELYVVVTDRRGRPVRGLGRESFEVLEEGVRQELAGFGDAADQPLTVGLAIDSSASMFVKLPDVQDAAANFVQSLRTRRDRAFVVGFGNEPKLARDTTSDMTGVVDGLYRLKPDGQTAIWKAVVYSLVQLQGAGGKKALIVFSDGADEDPDFSYRTALEFARRVGAPIYFIVSNDEIYRTAGKSLTVRGFLGRLRKLTSEVGGKVYLTKVTDDLGDVYSDIEEELRSQYLISYYARDFGGNRWRRVTVEVNEPGAEARTLSGYFR